MAIINSRYIPEAFAAVASGEAPEVFGQMLATGQSFSKAMENVYSGAGDLTVGSDMTTKDRADAERIMMDSREAEEGLSVLNPNYTDNHFDLAEKFFNRFHDSLSSVAEATAQLPQNIARAARTQLGDTLGATIMGGALPHGRLASQIGAEAILAMVNPGVVEAESGSVVSQASDAQLREAIARQGQNISTAESGPFKVDLTDAKRNLEVAKANETLPLKRITTLLENEGFKQGMKNVQDAVNDGLVTQQDIAAWQGARDIHNRYSRGFNKLEYPDPADAIFGGGQAQIGATPGQQGIDMTGSFAANVGEPPDTTADQRDQLRDQYSRPFYTQLYAMPGSGTLNTAEKNMMRQDAVTYFEASPEGILVGQGDDREDVFDEWLRDKYLQSPAAYRKGEDFVNTVNMISDVLSNPAGISGLRETDEVVYAQILGKYGPDAPRQEDNLKELAKLYITGGDRGGMSQGIHRSIDSYWDYLKYVEEQEGSDIFTTMIGLKRTPLSGTTEPTMGMSAPDAPAMPNEALLSATTPLGPTLGPPPPLGGPQQRFEDLGVSPYGTPFQPSSGIWPDREPPRGSRSWGGRPPIAPNPLHQNRVGISDWMKFAGITERGLGSVIPLGLSKAWAFSKEDPNLTGIGRKGE